VPPGLVGTVRQSLFAGLAVATRLHSTALRDDVRQAFVRGMDMALVVSALIAAAAMLVALAFMPGRAAAASQAVMEAEPVA
jgi:phenylalanyl-tRNA synthetase beta subunit